MYITISVLNYNTPLRKLQRLRKRILVLNLLKIDIVFTILSFEKENIYFNDEYVGKKIINALEN
jgi:uncharacterized protein YvpB